MTTQQIEHRIITAGATISESQDLAEVLWVEGWHQIPAWKPSSDLIQAAKDRLADWREDRREQAAIVRLERHRRIEAGYRSIPVSDPVRLNGLTEW